ncbi:TrkH family potassium uptake protein [Aestuariispira ectoiniformans]|uniref:TrkH family potassium uptake protein n=1 Tax=Aestuariispira ectoiniformans TaxID=2775080 RepID=UPI00223B5511|nr:TrkH family potassium uptake protein [Aestuariispira ectoiniformans]
MPDFRAPRRPDNPVEQQSGGQRPTFFVLGLLLSALAVLMGLSGLIGLLAHRAAGAFFESAVLTLLVGGVLMATCRPTGAIVLRRKGAFFLTALAWTVLPGFGALPLVFGEVHLSFADAYFEAVSGLTTTGSTVLSGLQDLPIVVAVWRALLQWMGGVGIIVMGIALLPLLRSGAMQLYRSESSDTSDKPFPRAKAVAGAVSSIYLSLTLACTILFWYGGMTFLDALIHAMTTLSTGGFSTHDNSFAAFQGTSLPWIAIIFMLLGGTPFVLFIRLSRRDPEPLLQDRQLRLLLFTVISAAVVMAGYRAWNDGVAFTTGFSEALFNVVSVVTTTGFAMGDYSQWGALPVVLFFFLTFLGGGTGSTAGGFKLMRVLILWEAARIFLVRAIYPHRVVLAKIQDRAIDEDILFGTLGFASLWVVTWAALSLALSVTGLDLVTSLSGAATALANVGPGLGDIIGPVGNFQSLPDTAKWLLSIGMVAGRLELLTLLVVLMPTFWRE